MSESNKVKESTQNTDTAVVEEEQSSPWYVFCSQGCGFCKKAEPIIEELNKEGYNILKLDVAEGDNQKLNQELQQEYNIQCGTPWFINAETGKGVCGYREKDIIKKWLDGEDIPTPPRPKSQFPRPPFMGASKKEETKWKKEYAEWTKENSHLPNIQTAEQILERPRPKTEPPKPPPVSATDEQFEEWGKTWDEWTKENSHLPNLQPASVIIENFKQRAQGAQPGAPQPPSKVAPPSPTNPSVNNNVKINTLDAKVGALEVKIDKIMSHFGVK